MYEEYFKEVGLTVVELPVEFENNLPVYRGLIKELSFITAEAVSKKAMYAKLAEQYQVYRKEILAQQQVTDEEKPALSLEEMLRYYDGEIFADFSLSDLEDENE